MDSPSALRLRRGARRSAARRAREKISPQLQALMNLRTSSISPDWWDYTCLPLDIVDEVARLTPRDIEKLSRPGFRVVFYDTLEDFYLAEALAYVPAWTQTTDPTPVGIRAPIGPTDHIPPV